MHNQNMIFDSFQYWQEPHNGNTHWIHEDGSNPFRMRLQKPPLSLSPALETRPYQRPGHSSINTGRLESHSFLHETYWISVLGRPVGVNLRLTQMYQPYCAWAVGRCWPQAQAHGNTSILQEVNSTILLKFYVHPGHSAQQSWSAQNAVKQSAAREEN